MHQPRWHTMRDELTGRVRFRLKRRWWWWFRLVAEIEVENVMQRYPGEYRNSQPYWREIDRDDWMRVACMGSLTQGAEALEEAATDDDAEEVDEVIPPHVFITARDPWLREMRTESPSFGNRPRYVATFAFQVLEGEGELTVTYSDEHTPALNQLLAYERTGGPLVIEIRHPRADET